jgi:hypothetical protein
MTYELNIAELDLVSGGDLKEVHFRPDYKEPTSSTTASIFRPPGCSTAMSATTRPLRPFRRECAAG